MHDGRFATLEEVVSRSPSFLPAGQALGSVVVGQWSPEFLFDVENISGMVNGTFQLGGKHWKLWNESMRKALVRTQQRDGSWKGGVETTALHLMCLNVYYRYDRVFGAHQR